MSNIQDFRAPFRALQNRNPEELFLGLPTPAYIIDEQQLRENGTILSEIAKETDARILLAQKAFSNFDFYPLLCPFLDGTESSGLYEARLGYEKMPNKEVHVYSSGYKYEEFARLMKFADHIVFNSISQLETFGPTAKGYGKSIGLRINPQCSTQKATALYDPCSAGCRLGVTREQWDIAMQDYLFCILDGLHFHTLCEQGPDALKTTLKAVNKSFGDILKEMQWINIGGGESITDPQYDKVKLIQCIRYAQNNWHTQVYLEPGEAVAQNAGFLVSRVLDIVENNGIKTAILDASPTCHAPDVIEMPYMPMVYGSGDTGRYLYRLAGPTCLAGDVWGEYIFQEQLSIGSMVVFGDMAAYTTCKNNTFNGMPLPNIWAWQNRRDFHSLTHFSYEDFLSRLGASQNACQK